MSMKIEDDAIKYFFYKYFTLICNLFGWYSIQVIMIKYFMIISISTVNATIHFKLLFPMNRMMMLLQNSVGPRLQTAVTNSLPVTKVAKAMNVACYFNIFSER